MVSVTEGWLTYTCWKRRSSAGSFSMCFRYSSYQTEHLGVDIMLLKQPTIPRNVYYTSSKGISVSPAESP